MISNVLASRRGIGFIGQAVAGAAASYPLLDNLIAYWNLDEASGTRYDSHTNGLHLTDNNTVGASSGGGPDGGDAALFVAANSEYLSRTSESLLKIGDEDFTFSLWVYTATVNKTLIYKANAEYRLDYVSTALGKFSFEMNNYAVIANVAFTSYSTWAFVVVTHDSAANTLSISVNNGTPVTVGTGGNYPANQSNAFRIGGGQFFMDGRMAYIGYWKRVLTSDEHTWLYNSGAGRTFAALAAYTG